MNYKLICFDMDGVLFKDINFWMELHKKFGTFEKGEVLTQKYLHTDYDKLVKEVVLKLWKGKNAKDYYDLIDSLEYLSGVEQVFDFVKSKGFLTAIISGGSIDAARRVQKDFAVDYLFANELVIKNGIVSGEFFWPIGVGNEKKAEIIKNLCKELEISPKEVVYVGDHLNDLQAFKEVGLAIAFNTNLKELKEVADIVVDSDDLSDVLEHI